MTGVRGPGESRDTAMAVEQDIFDAVVMADERFHGEGYQEGYEEGSSLGIAEGKQYGMLHGAKIGSEIGCYRGFALAWKCLLLSGTGEKDSSPLLHWLPPCCGPSARMLSSYLNMVSSLPSASKNQGESTLPP
uniref:protein LTO1 homolog isoform X3 n=1 Tax=Arvicanthis niloticus TaxID=61156 RepID=UPI0014875357|nr:protein LTO1 homolog isoform X3 [Arvicanthis niloticus]